MQDDKPQATDKMRGIDRWWRAKWALPNGGSTYSLIWAADFDEARSIAVTLRCERPKPHRGHVSEFRPSRLAQCAVDGLASLDVMHSLCYLSTLAGRASLVGVEDVVGDDSPLHELSHYLGLGGNVRNGKMKEHLLARIAWLESIIPGLPPDDIDLPTDKWMPGTGRKLEERACLNQSVRK
jgi:hypothetical protein